MLKREHTEHVGTVQAMYEQWLQTIFASLKDNIVFAANKRSASHIREMYLFQRQ